MLGNISINAVLEYVVVFVLLIQVFMLLLNAFNYLNLTVGSDQVKVEGLTRFVFAMLKAFWIIFKDSVYGLFPLDSEGGPLSTHQTYETGVRNFDYMVA